MDYDQIRRYMDNDLIEIAPLAYMRGRTLNDAVIILDEGQNATVPQMKMFLTRMGQNARIVVTGDITQVDLPPGDRQRPGRRGRAAQADSRGGRRSCSTARTSSGTRWCRRSSTPTRPARPSRPIAEGGLEQPSRPSRSFRFPPVNDRLGVRRRGVVRFIALRVITDHEISRATRTHRQAGAASARRTPAWDGALPRPRRAETIP